MAGMKITLSAAMRARDVSRPRPEQLSAGEGHEAPATAERGDPPAADGTPLPRTRRRRRHTR
jgi:hypothetical protein